MKRFPSLNFWLIVFGIIVIAGVVSLSVRPNSIPARPISDFKTWVEKGQVNKVKINQNGPMLEISGERSEPGNEKSIPFVTNVPAGDPTIQELYNKGINVEYLPENNNAWLSLLVQVLPIFLMIGLLVFILRSMRGGNDGAMSFARSRARIVSDNAPKTTFKEVAGCDEAKEELQEVVEFLKSPGRFHEIGARIPHGCLLIGPPGSGKTLLAKAVAGEAKVPFFTISGSDFVEMFVGVGAARVRDLFEQAKKSAPCIVFIDEIDAVGRKRGSGMGGGNDEREQTLNQLLVEMDGFETKHDIVILAATNRPDVLDAALLRPGRFDRQVTVDAPDVKGREEILRVHARKKPMDDSVDLKIIAKRTPGFVGADLENLLNEAALLAARAARKKINLRDIDEAADRVTMGPARRSRVISDEDKRITAYHEVGHGLAANVLPYAERVHKLTVVPRGGAAGYMMPLPLETMHYSKNRLLDRVAVALAGRAAEELVFGDVNTGAVADFKQATNIARRMVTEWGMSETLGHVAHVVEQENYLGYGGEMRNYSEETARRIDDEVTHIIESQYARVKDLLSERRQTMDTLVTVLLERETLTGDEFQTLLDGGELAPFEDYRSKDTGIHNKETKESGFLPPIIAPKPGRA